MTVAMLHLDYQQNLAFSWAGPVLLALTLMSLALTVAYYVELNNKAASWEDRLEQIERRQGRLSSSGDRDGVVLEVKHANEVLRQLTLPWDELFSAVESAAGKDVALLAMEPNAARHVVKISGEAKDMAALLNYVTQLEAQGVFGPVYLQSHQVQQQDPDKPVRFSLLATWREKP